MHFTINAISIHTSQNLWSAREIRSVSGVAFVQPLSKISFTDGYTQFLKTSSDTWNRIINHCFMYAEYVMVQILFRFHIFIPLYLEIIVILSHRRKWFQIENYNPRIFLEPHFLTYFAVDHNFRWNRFKLVLIYFFLCFTPMIMCLKKKENTFQNHFKSDWVPYTQFQLKHKM